MLQDPRAVDIAVVSTSEKDCPLMRSAATRLARLLLLFAAFAACVQWTIPHGWMIASAHEVAGEDVPLLAPCPATSPELAKLAERASGSFRDHHAHHGAMDYSAKGHGSDDAEGKDAMHGAAQAQCDFAAIGRWYVKGAGASSDARQYFDG